MSPHWHWDKTVSVVCQCSCIHYFKRVLVMPKMSVWGRPRELQSLLLLMHLYFYNAPCHYKFNLNFTENLILMNQNVPNVHSYKKIPVIEVPEIPQYLKLLLPFTLSSPPAFISNRPSRITVYHVAVTFELSLQCHNGCIIEPTSFDSSKP